MKDAKKQIKKILRDKSLERLKSGNAPRAKTWGGKPSIKTDRKNMKRELKSYSESYEIEESLANVKKSRGHIRFVDDVEYFVKNKHLYMADRRTKIGIDGYRVGQHAGVKAPDDVKVAAQERIKRENLKTREHLLKKAKASRESLNKQEN